MIANEKAGFATDTHADEKGCGITIKSYSKLIL